MDSDPAVHSGAGAVFHGDITAGRDVTISKCHVKRATKRLPHFLMFISVAKLISFEDLLMFEPANFHH
jgi:hypothetical protein